MNPTQKEPNKIPEGRLWRGNEPSWTCQLDAAKVVRLHCLKKGNQMY